jgi:hypothetical protein
MSLEIREDNIEHVHFVLTLRDSVLFSLREGIQGIQNFSVSPQSGKLPETHLMGRREYVTVNLLVKFSLILLALRPSPTSPLCNNTQLDFKRCKELRVLPHTTTSLTRT